MMKSNSMLSSFASQKSFQDVPLKVIVSYKHVGAIIGEGGCNIRNISKQTNARLMVDVNNPTVDENGNAEKLVWINGSVNACSSACAKVLEIIQNELKKDDFAPKFVELKIRAPNQLIGRVIGKGGSLVKKIMEESGASISSNDSRILFDYSLFPAFIDNTLLERVITIRGSSIDIVSLAENKISYKLRVYYKYDMANKKNYAENSQFTPFIANTTSSACAREFPNMNICPLPICTSSSFNSMPNPSRFYAPNNFPINSRTQSMTHQFNPIYLKSQIYVSKSFIGAIIGRKGSYIQNMMYLTGAKIRIQDDFNHQRKLNKTCVQNEKNTILSALPDKSKDNETSDDTSHHNHCEKNVTNIESEMGKGDSINVLSLSVKKDDNVDCTNDITSEISAENEVIKNENENVSSLATSIQNCSLDNKENVVSEFLKKQNVSLPSCFEVPDRFVLISGFDFQVYKAEFYIFQRIAEINHSFIDNLILSTDVFVPIKIVGRIIGKSGRNIRNLQAITRAQINVPEILKENKEDTSHMTPIKVTGTFFSLQAVQAHFTALIEEFEIMEGKQVYAMSTSCISKAASQTVDKSIMPVV